MRIIVLAAASTAVFASYSSAYALSVTNRDGTDQKITITEGEKQREEVVAATKTLSNICSAGCVIKLQNGEEYEFDGNEIVSIEEGLMFLDEPAQDEPADGAGQKPPADSASQGKPQGNAPQANTPTPAPAQTASPPSADPAAPAARAAAPAPAPAAPKK